MKQRVTPAVVLTAAVILALVAWTVFCLVGVASTLAEEYDGFFTDGTVVLYLALIAVPWAIVIALWWAARTSRAAR